MVYNALLVELYLPGDESLKLKDRYYCPCNCNQPIFDTFVYESKCKTVTTLWMNMAKKHDAIEKGFLWLQRLRIKKFQYIAVEPLGPVDILFSNDWNGLPVPEKYLLTLESLL